MSTLRQKLLADAEAQLEAIEAQALGALDRVAKMNGVDTIDLGKLVTTKRVASIRQNMIRDIANKKEAELVKMYSQQQDGFANQEEEAA